ncbi:MAG: tetratricopeptide repeat protein, partial [bacterium]|nr:tetratricopeptide repeat protein [bacterium]
PLLHEALAIQRRALDREHPDLASTLVQLGQLLTSEGDPEAAETLLREGLGIRRRKLLGHWLVAHAESALGECLTELERYAEAEALLLRSYPQIKERHGEHDQKTLQALDRLIDLYRAWNKPDGLAEYEAKKLASLQAR